MKEKIEFLFRDKMSKVIFAFLVLSGLVALLSSSHLNSPPAAGDQEKDSHSFSADTIIPAGFVLIPIEIQNLEALSSIVGQYGIVDLFTTALNGQRSGLKVASHLKLLRAPLNPNQFAVLTPEAESQQILKYSGPFFAVIQNPEAKEGAHFQSRKVGAKFEYFKSETTRGGQNEK